MKLWNRNECYIVLIKVEYYCGCLSSDQRQFAFQILIKSVYELTLSIRSKSFTLCNNMFRFFRGVGLHLVSNNSVFYFDLVDMSKLAMVCNFVLDVHLS